MARINASIWGRPRASRNLLLVIIDDHRWRRAAGVRLLTVTQDKLHASVLNRAWHETGGRGCIHRDNHAAPQKDSPEAGDPFGRIGTPKKYAITRENSAAREGLTPKKSVCVKLCVRQLLPTVAASLDDSDIAGKAAKIGEKAQEIRLGHNATVSLPRIWLDSTPEAAARPLGLGTHSVCDCGSILYRKALTVPRRNIPLHLNKALARIPEFSVTILVCDLRYTRRSWGAVGTPLRTGDN